MFSPHTTINIASRIKFSVTVHATDSLCPVLYSGTVGLHFGMLALSKLNKNALILKIHFLAVTILALFPVPTPKLFTTCEKKLGSGAG